MKRLSTWAATLAVLALAVVLVVGCGTQPAGAGDSNEPQSGVVVQWVDTRDGFEVQCVRLYNAGLSCDWDRKRYKK